ncbi:hypothetical protein [Gimesia aquarii]|uniref:Uncharacterized protein n=1 Tax=Gimesia aquarii TaxID=2527964 RepID=A0A517WR27_9PLAN|nr:hypothetical protein [Gimesia aquarii]QDU07703.1 hypothetical protein V202x_10640 [Gimesia aquarii]
MTEHEKSEKTSSTSDQKYHKRRRKVLLVIAILFLLLFPVISETYFRCAICSMLHTRWRIMGLGLPLHSWKQPVESSDWYQTNIEAKHQHVWVQTGYLEGKTFYGLKTLMLQESSLSTGPFVYLSLGNTGQMRIYQKSSDPKEARKIFLRLAHNEPYGSDAYKEQLEIWRRLNEWMESRMEDPWPFETQ